jgi:hypothetical protein
MGEGCTLLHGFTGFSARSVNAEKFGVQLKRPGLIVTSLRPDLRDVQLWDLPVPELGIVMQHGSRSRAVSRDGCLGTARSANVEQMFFLAVCIRLHLLWTFKNGIFSGLWLRTG